MESTDTTIERRCFIKSVGMGTAALFTQGWLTSCTSGYQRPNFVFILVDDLGWKDAGFMGSQYYETPNIDRLASQGITFTDAYASAPNCAPSRACLLTGQYSPRHGIYTVNNPERGPDHLRKLIPIPNRTTLDPETVSIAEALKPAGYVSASIGKWHLGNDPQNGPISKGFDINIGGFSAGTPPSYFSPYRNENLTDGPEGEYLTDRLNQEALKFIEENRSTPFFLYLTHYAVHTPIRAKEELISKYRQKADRGGHNNPTYAAMIESVDQGVGAILDKLDEHRLTDNTVVILFSDNGGYGPVTSMEPLRGSKGMLYEGGIREPMIVRWPGRIKPGSSSGTPVIIIDFYPTILELAGVPSPPGHTLDGESLVPLLDGDQHLHREALFWHFPAYLEADRSVEGPFRTTPAGAVRRGDWKLIEFFEDGKLELYNLREDIGESINQADQFPDKTKEMHDLLRRWRESTGAPVPTELNPRYDPAALPPALH